MTQQKLNYNIKKENQAFEFYLTNEKLNFSFCCFNWFG